MVSGGLMQLIAYGAQDLYLTGNSQITFFKTIYRKHTKLANNIEEEEFCKYIYDKYESFQDKDKYNQTSCPICCEEYYLADDIVIWGCQHIYHKKCHQMNICCCPVCRHDDPYDPVSEEEYNNIKKYDVADMIWENTFLSDIDLENDNEIITIII